MRSTGRVLFAIEPIQFRLQGAEAVIFAPDLKPQSGFVANTTFSYIYP